jgi:hypothetical protein
MRSRSRDRTFSTREPRAFHLTSGKSLLDPNNWVPVQRSAEKNVLQASHPSTASLLDDRIWRVAPDPTHTQ